MADEQKEKQNTEIQGRLYEEKRVYGTRRQLSARNAVQVEKKSEKRLSFDWKWIALGVTVVFMIVIAYFMAQLIWPEARIFNRKPGDVKLPGSVDDPGSTDVNGPLTYFGVVLRTDTGKKTVTFRNVLENEERTLSYAGDTKFYRKSGSQTTASTLEAGDLMEFTCKADDESEIKTARWIPGYWEFNKVEDLAFVPADGEEYDGMISFKGKNYSYTDALCVISNEEVKDFSDLNPDTDRVTVRGIGKTALEIVVVKGHGTVCIVNAGRLSGGVLAVGNKLAFDIEEGAEFVVREGEYTIEASYGRWAFSDRYEVKRGEKLVIDLEETLSAILGNAPSPTKTATPTPSPTEGPDIASTMSVDELKKAARPVSIDEWDYETDDRYKVYIIGPIGASVYLGVSTMHSLGEAPLVFDRIIGAEDIIIYYNGPANVYPYESYEEGDLVFDYGGDFG